MSRLMLCVLALYLLLLFPPCRADEPPKFLETLPGEENFLLTLRTVVFSPDGKILATTAGDDKNLRLWDVAAKKDIGLLKGHEWTIWSAAFSRDGKLLATGSTDQTVKIWDIASKKEKITLTIQKTGPFAKPMVYGVVFSVTESK
jgi:WD40 repeat protein